MAMARAMLGSDVLPCLCANKARQVADVGCCNDDVLSSERQRLSSQDHINVNGVIGRGWLSLLACLGPKLGGPAHRRGRERQVFGRPGELVEAANAGWIACAEEVSGPVVG